MPIWTDYRTRLPCLHAYADLQGFRGVCPKREDHRNRATLRELTSIFLLLQWTIPTAKEQLSMSHALHHSPVSLHRSKTTARSLLQRNPTRKTNTRKPLHTRMLLLARLLCRFGGLGYDAKKFLRRMKAVALSKGRYRLGIDQVHQEVEGKYCMLCGASECSKCA